MINCNIFYYINLILKSIIIVILIIVLAFLNFFPPSIIFLLIGFFLGYIIIYCKVVNEYQKFKNYYLKNLIGEIIVISYLIFFIIFEWPKQLSIHLLLILLIISIIVLLVGLIYFFSRRAEIRGIKPRPDILEKLRDILSVSNRIKLERVQNVLNLDDKVFDEKIIEWAKEFGFRIDGEYLIVNKESISEFIEALDEKFVEWEKKEKDNDGKF